MFVANTRGGRSNHAKSCNKLQEHVATLYRIAEGNENSLPDFAANVSSKEISCSKSSDIWTVGGKLFKAKDFGSSVNVARHSDRNVFYKIVLASHDAKVLKLKTEFSARQHLSPSQEVSPSILVPNAFL